MKFIETRDAAKPCPDLKDLATGQRGNSDRLGGRTSEANEKVKKKKRANVCQQFILIVIVNSRKKVTSNYSMSSNDIKETLEH